MQIDHGVIYIHDIVKCHLPGCRQEELWVSYDPPTAAHLSQNNDVKHMRLLFGLLITKSETSGEIRKISRAHHRPQTFLFAAVTKDAVLTSPDIRKRAGEASNCWRKLPNWCWQKKEKKNSSVNRCQMSVLRSQRNFVIYTGTLHSRANTGAFTDALKTRKDKLGWRRRPWRIFMRPYIKSDHWTGRGSVRCVKV